MTVQLDTDADLEGEARTLSRYLLGYDPTLAQVALYIAADRQVARKAGPTADEALIRFAQRHPWAVGPLDAAAALLRPGTALRAKILRMAAILEASLECADHFLPRSCSRLAVAWHLAVAGMSAAWQLLIGIPLLAVAGRQR